MIYMTFAVAVAVGYLPFSLPAATADVAAWCAVIKGGEYWDCQYRSLEDCRPNVIGGGRGWCNPNPYSSLPRQNLKTEGNVALPRNRQPAIGS